MVGPMRESHDLSRLRTTPPNKHQASLCCEFAACLFSGPYLGCDLDKLCAAGLGGVVGAFVGGWLGDWVIIWEF